MEDTIINKVEKSGLIQLDLSKFWSAKATTTYDIANDLWQGIALKEKAFRAKLKETNWSNYQDQFVGIHCSADAIVPMWAYMLVSACLQPFAKETVYGDLLAANNAFFKAKINAFNLDEYRDGRIIVKGCSDLHIDQSVYLHLINTLQPVAKSVMFGEPCSTVPLFKRKK